MTSVRGDGPLLTACLRHADLRPEVDALDASVRRDARTSGPSDADRAVLEHALRLAEAWSGRVLAVAAGGPEVEPTLRLAASVGSEVLRVPWAAAGESAYEQDLGADEHALAGVVASALRAAGPPALVLCGDRSADRGTGAFPAYLAAELGAAQALGCVSIDAETAEAAGAGDPATHAVRVTRRLDGGRREVLRLAAPAVCSLEAAGTRLRRAGLGAALAAETAAVPVAPAPPRPPEARVAVRGVRPARPRTRTVPPPSGAARDRLLALTGALVAHEPPVVIGPVGAEEAADALEDFLRKHGYLDT